jgi:LacI family transcriptional regulator
MQISEETKQRVLQAARDLGYVPDAAAQALASGRSKNIGLLLARRPHIIASDMFLTQILDVLAHEINRHGMRLLLQIVEDFQDREAYLKLVRSNSLDGVIYSGPRIEDAPLFSLIEHNIPTVLMGTLPGTGYYFVDVDNRAAANRAVSHLIGLGHVRIGIITNAPPVYVAAVDRLQGYQDALANAHLPLDQGLVRYGEFDPESGYEQMKYLLDAPSPPTAVFVASDVVAFGAMAAIRERGLNIPRDIALVGFDDVPVSRYIEPSLTTIQLPVTDLAKSACDIVVCLVHGEKPPQAQMLLEANLVIRNSCGAMKGHPFYGKSNDLWEVS